MSKAFLTREFYTSGYTLHKRDEETGAEIWRKDKPELRACYGIGFSGKRSKPDYNLAWGCEKREERRAEYEQKFITALLERKAEDAAYKLKKAQPHTLKIGDILYCTWGYGQTNVDFYQVRAVRGAMVDISKIAYKTEAGSEGMDCDRVVAVANAFTGDSLRKRPAYDNSIRIESYAKAYPWDGKSVYRSWYY